ncbi:MAG: YicC/YloC family endoribonuclease [Atribacterota bacterium]
MRSMTGFGYAEGEGVLGFYRVSVKSVNHRFCDIALRLPKELCLWEEAMMTCLRERVSRGKVELKVFFDPRKDAFSVEVNPLLAQAYLEALGRLSRDLKLDYTASFEDLLRFSDVIRLKEDDRQWLEEYEAFRPIFQNAVETFLSFRKREGEKLQQDLLSQLQRIRILCGMVEDRTQNLTDFFRSKLTQRIAEILSMVPVNETLLAQEVVFYVDRSDIHEEIVRIKAHVSRFEDILRRQEAVGRELEVVLQEMNREVNTIGSKSGNIDISSQVIDLKTVLEKMREQVQNVE